METVMGWYQQYRRFVESKAALSISKGIWLAIGVYAAAWIIETWALEHAFVTSFEPLKDFKGCYVLVDFSPILQCPHIILGNLIERAVNILWLLPMWAAILPVWLIDSLLGSGDAIVFPYSTFAAVILILEIVAIRLLIIYPMHKCRKTNAVA